MNDGDIFARDPERLRRVAHELFLEIRPMVERCEDNVRTLALAVGELRDHVERKPLPPSDVTTLAGAILAVLGDWHAVSRAAQVERVAAIEAVCNNVVGCTQ